MTTFSDPLKDEMFSDINLLEHSLCTFIKSCKVIRARNNSTPTTPIISFCIPLEGLTKRRCFALHWLVNRNTCYFSNIAILKQFMEQSTYICRHSPNGHASCITDSLFAGFTLRLLCHTIMKFDRNIFCLLYTSPSPRDRG